jgi:putative FmdB family regulatory protein
VAEGFQQSAFAQRSFSLEENTMPIYEYACAQCGHQFEALVRSGTEPQCPECHSHKLEKQLSVFATTASSSQAAPLIPNPCGSCGNPGGPGSCAFKQ